MNKMRANNLTDNIHFIPRIDQIKKLTSNIVDSSKLRRHDRSPSFEDIENVNQSNQQSVIHRRFGANIQPSQKLYAQSYAIRRILEKKASPIHSSKEIKNDAQETPRFIINKKPQNDRSPIKNNSAKKLPMREVKTRDVKLPTKVTVHRKTPEKKTLLRSVSKENYNFNNISYDSSLASKTKSNSVHGSKYNSPIHIATEPSASSSSLRENKVSSQGSETVAPRMMKKSSSPLLNQNQKKERSNIRFVANFDENLSDNESDHSKISIKSFSTSHHKGKLKREENEIFNSVGRQQSPMRIMRKVSPDRVDAKVAGHLKKIEQYANKIFSNHPRPALLKENHSFF